MTMKSYKSVPGFFNYEALYYHQVKEANNEDTFVEVGSLWGRSVIFMAQCCKDLQKNINIYSVDYWDYRGVPELMTPGLDPSGLDYQKDGTDCLYNAYLNNLKECGVDDLIKPIRTSSEEASKQFEDNSIDFLFIDAGHTYDDVMNDLNCWYKKVKNGKTISGHDYDWDGVRMAVNEFFGASNIKIHNTSWVYEKPIFDIDNNGLSAYKKYNLYN